MTAHLSTSMLENKQGRIMCAAASEQTGIAYSLYDEHLDS